MKKIKSRLFERNKDIIIAFFFCAFSMLLFAELSILQFGSDTTLIMGDAQELYLPGIKAFARSIWNGQGITYSWDLSMGMNAVEYYTAVVGGSMINILYLIFPFMSLETFLIISLVVKGGLCGTAFVWFAKRILDVEGSTAILFSIFYSLCGFQVCINSVNYIWIDMVYMLPIIITLIVVFIQKGNWLLLVLSYTYLFLCNFYIAYIVGFFSALFLVLYLLIYNRKKIISLGFNYASKVILAAGLAAFALLPTAEFMMNKYHSGLREDKASIIGKNIFLHLSRFLWGHGWTDQLFYPYIYCGIITLILLPLYFINKKIDIKEKLLYTTLLFIMLLSCILYPLYIFWHGFDEPDMWYYRFAFIISFLCVSMACKSLYKIGDYKPKVLFFSGLLSLLFFIAMGIYSMKIWEQPSEIYLIINVVLFIVWTGLIICKHKKKMNKYLNYIFVVFAMMEVISNGCIGHSIKQKKVDFEIMEEEMNAVLGLLNDDNGFYRINNENRLLINSDTQWGYKGIADFCSFENQELRATLSNLGAYSSSRVIKGHGLNDFTQMILNVKYNIILSGVSNRDEMGARVYPYPRYLNLGFLVNKNICDIKLTDNVYENNNLLVSSMMGEDIPLFTRISEDMISVEENGIVLREQGGYFLLNDYRTEETNTIVYSVPYNGNNAYVTFGSYNRGILGSSPLIWEPDSGRDNGELTVRYTKKMDYDGEKLICTVMMKNDLTDNEGYYDQVEFYYEDEKLLDKVYENLSAFQLQIEKYKNGYIKGNVNVEDESKILFTSIPYDKGWKVKSKQGNVEIIPLVEEAFLGIVFPAKGNYDLELKYEVPGLNTGIIISVISLCIIVALRVNKVDKERDGRRKVQENN